MARLVKVGKCGDRKLAAESNAEAPPPPITINNDGLHRHHGGAAERATAANPTNDMTTPGRHQGTSPVDLTHTPTQVLDADQYRASPLLAGHSTEGTFCEHICLKRPANEEFFQS